MKNIIPFLLFHKESFVMKKHPGVLFYLFLSGPLVFLLYSWTTTTLCWCCCFIPVLTSDSLTSSEFVFFKIIFCISWHIAVTFLAKKKSFIYEKIHIGEHTNQESKFNAFSKIDLTCFRTKHSGIPAVPLQLILATLPKSNHYSII